MAGGEATANVGDMRQRIVLVAGRLFAERGFEGTSVRDIASALGISNPSLYYHFASKAELLEEVLREPMERVRRAASHALTLDGADRTRALVEGMLEALEVHGGAVLLAVNTSGRPSDAHRTLAEAGLFEVALLLGGFEQPRGVDALALTMAMAAIEGAVRQLMARARNEDEFVVLLREHRSAIADVAMRILAPG